MTGSQMTPPAARRFLMLQGPTNMLFAQVAEGLRALGHEVFRINICLGDQIFWRGPGASNFRSRPDEWPSFIATFLDRHRIDEILLLAEQRTHHLAAIAAARARNIPVTVTDFGYLRPDWVVVERNGMNAESTFTRDPAAILAMAEGLPPLDKQVRHQHRFFNQALWDMTFHLSSALMPLPFPHFQRHTLSPPILTYLGIGWRLLRGPFEQRRAESIVAAARRQGPLYVFAMQTEDDYSLRAYSHYASQDEAMHEVILSFARHAPKDANLIFKLHPLDPGLKAWGRRTKNMARAAGVASRVHFIDGGDLDSLLLASAGVVTINSTVGLRAIELQRPTIALGKALYRVPGLTFERPLDDFWTANSAPDARLVDAYLRAIAATLHVRGGYYERNAIRAAAEGMVYRLHHQLVNVPVAAVVRGEPLLEQPTPSDSRQQNRTKR